MTEPTGRATVLLVEDDPNSAEGLRRILEEAGYRAEHVAAGEEVMQRVRRGRPDVIVLDLVLPGIDGIAVARLLRGDAEGASIPLVAATASWLGSKPEWLIEAGFAGALRKPFTAEQLLAEIGRVRSRVASPSLHPRPARAARA